MTFITNVIHVFLIKMDHDDLLMLVYLLTPPPQPTFTCLKLTIGTLKQGVKYIQNYQ